MKVVVAKADSYVQKGIEEGVGVLGGLSTMITKGERVLLKPNMVDGLTPDKAATTHPEVVTERSFCFERSIT